MSDAIQSRLKEERKLELIEAMTHRALLLLPIPVLLGVVLPFRPGAAFWGLWLIGVLAILVLASLVLRPVPRRIDEVDREIGAHDGLLTWVLATAGGGGATLADPSYELLRRELEIRLAEDEVQAHHQPRLKRLSKRLLALAALVLLLALLGPLIWGGFRAAKAFAIANGIVPIPVRVANPDAQQGQVTKGKTSDDARQSEGAQAQAPDIENPEVDPLAQKGDTVGPQLPSPRRHIPPRTRLRPNPDQPRSQPPEYEPRTDWTRQVERALGRGVLEDWEGQWLGAWGRYLDRRKVEMGGRPR